MNDSIALGPGEGSPVKADRPELEGELEFHARTAGAPFPGNRNVVALEERRVRLVTYGMRCSRRQPNFGKRIIGR